ncbi:ZIP family zinc transporter [Legionella israelensis]|uniref:ZIP family zinc transporter n=1 Tax=Legionella israelensis TaxID=454 RepID=A0AAX1EFE6_9GAMM|nr:ZIP family metal transporter [Legionella israelensis]QBR83783.1 ZIP family zinc transporter [Legionella israelensis]
MDNFLLTLLIALLPAFGNFLGGIIAELFYISDKALSLSLHMATGILIAVVGIEIMPKALDVTLPWAVIFAFMVGGVFFTSLNFVQKIFSGTSRQETNVSSPWLIYIGVSTDLLSDGLMIGAGSALSTKLGIILALGQVLGDLPEGFAMSATLKKYEYSAMARFLLLLCFAIPVMFGAAFGYLVLQNAPDIFKYIVLAFTAGILLSVAVEEMLTEAHQSFEPVTGTVLLLAGFSLFALVTAYL